MVEVSEPLTKSPSGWQRIADESYDHPYQTESADMNLSTSQSAWTYLRHRVEGRVHMSTWKRVIRDYLGT